jgi:hypothetical protein
MNLLSVPIYLIVGAGEWFLALRRTLAVSRGETKTLVVIVFLENFLGLWVLSSFVKSNDWWLALAYSFGGSLGALLMKYFDKKHMK